MSKEPRLPECGHDPAGIDGVTWNIMGQVYTPKQYDERQFVWHATFTGFIERGDCTTELTSVTAPALLIRGERDSYVSTAAQESLLQVLPHAKLITYEGHGHACHWENPERFVNDLVLFLTSHRASASATASAAAPHDRIEVHGRNARA